MITTSAFSKINLGLEVLHKRPDGYHSINTVFHRISLHDTICIELDEKISTHCPRLSGLPQEENLAYKAAQMLQKAFSIKDGAKITIHKHIPIGAGLGGGSSDAATVLLTLCRLWNVHPGDEHVFQIARTLGADVPYFLGDSAALAGGIGDNLEYFDVELGQSVLLVDPAIHLSTAWAYQTLNRDSMERTPREFRDAVIASQFDVTLFRKHLVNDFEDVVFQHHPGLAAIKKQMYDVGARYAQMTGSGSVMFGLFDSPAQALESSIHFRPLRTFVCHFINHKSN